MNPHQALPVSQGTISIISQTIPHNAIVVSSPDRYIDLDWLNYFNKIDALMSVAADIAKLTSTKKTPEQHTLRSYEPGLKHFLKWSKDELPSPSLLNRYIADLSTKYNQRTGDYGLSSTTIACKYMAPVRHYLRALALQLIIGDNESSNLIRNYRDQINFAREIKNPPPDETSNISAVYRHGNPLTKRQCTRLLGKIDRTTVAGKRDYALLLTAFLTGLRLAELHRLTLSNIDIDPDDEDEYLIINLRRKRCKYDPTSIGEPAVDAIEAYVEAYNATLDEDDPRRITDTTPLWQSLTRSGNHLPIGHKTGIHRYTKQAIFYDPSKGMSISGISAIINKRASIAPHDTRRSAATMANAAGMDISDISHLLGHKSEATTAIYIKRRKRSKKSNLANIINLG